MTGFLNGWKAWAATAAVVMTTAACSTYPDAPRYSTRPVPPPAIEAPPAAVETPPPPPVIVPYEEIEGAPLDSPSSAPDSVRDAPPPPGSAAATAGAATAPATSAAAFVAYVVQPGDTVSGVGRRFQTSVQTLVDLNNLGPTAHIAAGQRLRLPAAAVDIGSDPYATGPSPTGVNVSNAGVPAPPPPPSTRPTTPASPPAPSAPASPPAAATTVALDWPVRGDIVRRFGPGGMGERNNGVNIAAERGAQVRTAAAGRVGYVGSDLAGQGLTVLIVHRDGWRTVYSHLGSTTVRDGQEVAAGHVIGTVGTTAGDGRPSIHFETWRMRGDEPVALDPLTILPR